ncbi:MULTISPECIES: hypothetical protein [unclassified Solwaraspora]|uniref:hypothetical protein n=1 Tax=unclassified Solwaraspora TaxID=2627926 RepID=UPI00248CC4F3|nr:MULTISPECIES: hypothetical protein [unclassified Solwaraspora]WBB96613.1 hypothetical protein O7553_25485 [Solwaraspora sp. WMMA2059]WBC19483.1 hypothetical protein O7543_21885 [Solwaraspora sp. WMMA2080]WJK32934.1 hypothetical protein O7610_19675 [Solwaraspora sp. WMMA2065]
MRQTEHSETRQWLDRHGLTEAEPTPLLATRLAVRRRAKLVGDILLAGFLIGAALTHATGRATDTAYSWLPLLVLTALVVGMLAAQWLLRQWVRRVDRRAGAQLPRRVAHPVGFGWPAVLGRPYAVFTVAAYTGALVLAVSVLPVSDPVLRAGAAVVLIGLAGAGAGMVMQLRQVLTSPAVAEDEASLTADVVMRVEDARALVTPSLVWMLPAIFLYGESLGWWNAVAIGLVVAGVVAFGLVQTRTTAVGATARQAMIVR